jgi:hypothetical protein
MRAPILAVLGFLIGTTTGSAQVRVAGRLGATWSSRLVEDQIINPIRVKAGIAPTLSLGLSIPSGKRYRLGIETTFTSGSVMAVENGSDTDLGTLRTATILLTAEGPAMAKGLFWRVGFGVVKFLPTEKQGLFLQGGPTKPTANLTVEYRRTLRPGWEWTAAARYGFHQFLTKEMETRGFSRGQDVHRVGLEVGAARYFQ